MGITCQILVKKPPEGVHKAGKPIVGTVKYTIGEPTEYKDVTLSLLGRGECSWSEGSDIDSTNYRGIDDFISCHINVTKKKPEKLITLHGSYEHPFEFYLPKNIPTSYKDSTGSIIYSIQMKFVKKNFFSFDKVFTTEILVYSFVDPKTRDGNPAADRPVIFGLEKSLFAPFTVKKPMVNLKAEIAKTFLAPGENVRLSYVVTNHTDVAIASVRTGLYCYMSYTADCGSTKQTCFKVKQCEVETPGVPDGEVGNFSCVLPIPTHPELFTIQHSNVIARNYKVRMTLRLPAPHMKATVEIPIVIGERRKSAELCVDDCDADTQLPTYWEVMGEKTGEQKK